MNDPPVMTGEVTRDGFLDGALMLEQPVRGHRVGTDAALLVAAARGSGASDIYDFGAGVGAVGLALARLEGAQVWLVEIDPAIAAIARRNCLGNGLAERATVIEADIGDTAAARQDAGLMPNSADLVVMNPPYLTPGRQRPSPDAYRRLAHIGDGTLLDTWCRTAAGLLRARGKLIQINRADALPHLLAALDKRFGDIRILPVSPMVGEPAHRVLVRAVLGSRAALTLLPPFALSDRNRVSMPEALALHRGAHALSWHTAET